jgi:hypothetical protein
MFSFVFRKSLLQNRNAIARSPTLKRAYATHPEQNDTKPSNNNGMILGLIAAAGLGYYFFMRPGKLVLSSPPKKYKLTFLQKVPTKTQHKP